MDIQDLLMGDVGAERIVLDTETTGLEVRDGERIASFAALRGDLLRGVAETRQWFVDTEGRKSDPGAMRVHRLADDDARRRHEVEVFAEIEEMIGDRVVIFQNGAFDMGFINAAYDRMGRPRPPWLIEDTMVMGRRRFPGRQANLDNLCRLVGYDGPVLRKRKLRHDATDDCVLTFEVWRRLVSPDALELEGGPSAMEAAIARAAGPTSPIPTFPITW